MQFYEQENGRVPFDTKATPAFVFDCLKVFRGLMALMTNAPFPYQATPEDVTYVCPISDKVDQCLLKRTGNAAAKVVARRLKKSPQWIARVD